MASYGFTRVVRDPEGCSDAFTAKWGKTTLGRCVCPYCQAVRESGHQTYGDIAQDGLQEKSNQSEVQ